MNVLPQGRRDIDCILWTVGVVCIKILQFHLEIIIPRNFIKELTRSQFSLLPLFYTVNEIITVHGRQAICTLIGWLKSFRLLISLSGFCAPSPTRVDDFFYPRIRVNIWWKIKEPEIPPVKVIDDTNDVTNSLCSFHVVSCSTAQNMIVQDNGELALILF